MHACSGAWTGEVWSGVVVAGKAHGARAGELVAGNGAFDGDGVDGFGAAVAFGDGEGLLAGAAFVDCGAVGEFSTTEG